MANAISHNGSNIEVKVFRQIVDVGQIISRDTAEYRLFEQFQLATLFWVNCPI